MCLDHLLMDFLDFFRSSLAKSLRDVIDKKHDNVACKQNCKENGKVFNHAPHQCRYFSNSPEYNDLLKFLKIDASAYPTLPKEENEEDSEKIVDFALKLNDLEEVQNEVKLGCRIKEDVTQQEKHVADL